MSKDSDFLADHFIIIPVTLPPPKRDKPSEPDAEIEVEAAD